MTREPRVVARLERATFRAEGPLRWLVGSNRLNPLPHSGTISVFLLGVVIFTGVYITLFFQFGFDASYESVRRMDNHALQKVVRAIHRYASAGLVLTTLVHAWRTFVAGRFGGPRRWRWTTGVAALALVWLAGVTGYWLVWDQRAQALNDATTNLFGRFGWASAWLVRNVEGSGSGTGWGILFAMWLVHLLLTVVIAYFIWRHLRRSRFTWVSPHHWMILMGAALVGVSIALPVGMLGPADPSRLVSDLPLDPFVLFLLPPLLHGWAWLAFAAFTAIIVVALVGPHVWRRTPPVVEINDGNCTGCELCVIDCPYLAMTMQDRPLTGDDIEGVAPRRPIAVVDPSMCVGCGICLGSCSFGAMDLDGFDGVPAIDPAGRNVVVACSRHIAANGGIELADDVAMVEVSCTGALNARAIGSLMKAGAAGVQVVGCTPGDCAYGLGNTLAHERLSGERAPHVPPRWAGNIDEDWVAPSELVNAIAEPNRHHSVDSSRAAKGRKLVGASALVVASVAAMGFATRAPYAGASEESGIRVLVDHTPGKQLQGQPVATGNSGDEVTLVVRRDGIEVGRSRLGSSGQAAVGLVDFDVPSGDAEVEVVLIEGTIETLLFSGPFRFDEGARFVVEAVDVPPPPGVGEGRDVFNGRNTGGCAVCHSTRSGDDGVGPSLAGVADRGADLVPGLDAAAYLRQSILDPDAFVVDGYRPGQMLPTYDERLSPEQLDSVVEYLLTLSSEEPS